MQTFDSHPNAPSNQLNATREEYNGLPHDSPTLQEITGFLSRNGECAHDYSRMILLATPMT
jgi:hypothetical protein